MAISEVQARKIADELIKASDKRLVITHFYSVNYEGYDEGVYIFWVRDCETGMDYVPGELFGAINKADGTYVDICLPAPGC